MLERLAGFPDGVLAVSAGERVTGEDYREVLVPAAEAMLREHDSLRLLYYLGPEFKRFTTTALWDDARFGFHHLRDIERVAVVTDVEYLHGVAQTAARALPAEIRVFANAELADAQAWISEGLS